MSNAAKSFCVKLNKLERLTSAKKHFHHSLAFASRLISNPSGAPYDDSTVGRLLAIRTKFRSKTR